MKTSFDTTATRAEIKPQMTRFVAWSKGLSPDRQSSSALGPVSAADIDSLRVDRDVIPGMKAVLKTLGNGEPVSATQMIDGLTRAVDEEVARVAAVRDPATLEVKEMRQIAETFRPLALRAVAYAHPEYFGSFADSSREFEKLNAAAMGLEYPVLSPEALSIVQAWLTFHKPDLATYEPPATWKVRARDVPRGPISKQTNTMRRQLGTDYRVSVYRDPSTDTYAVFAQSANGPNQESVSLFKASGERIADIKLNDDGSIEAEPDFPEAARSEQPGS